MNRFFVDRGGSISYPSVSFLGAACVKTTDEFNLPDDPRFENRSSDSFDDHDIWVDDVDQEESITRHWVWLFVFGIAWLLFELSVDPAISVMVASIGLGGNLFLSAWWLWRRDPDRRRARAVAAFYLAAGFWRITAVTFVLFFIATIISLILDFRHGQKDDIVTGVAASIIALCFISSGVTTSVAVVLAMRNRLKVWLDPEIRLARRQGQWPPRTPGPNRIGGVIKSTACLLAMIELSVGYGFLAWLIIQQQNGPANIALGIFIGIMIFLPIITAAATILGGPEWACRKLRAESPQQCWPAPGDRPKRRTGQIGEFNHPEA